MAPGMAKKKNVAKMRGGGMMKKMRGGGMLKMRGGGMAKKINVKKKKKK